MMPDELERLEQALRRVLWELRSYLGDIVVIGGWVPHLYRRYGGFTEWRSSISLTGEVDILVRQELPAEDRPPIADLLSQAGYRPLGDDRASAVWVNDPARGERVEFLVPHAGTAKQLGTVHWIMRQPGLGAIALTDLEMLQQFTGTLQVPVTARDGRSESLPVRVPQLGTYAVVKASTFGKRTRLATANPKRAKDLLYLRDLMAAGNEVSARIREDLRRNIGENRRTRSYVAGARSKLDPMIRHTGEELDDAAQMLAERDGQSRDAALADLKGHIADMLGVIDDVLG